MPMLFQAHCGEVIIFMFFTPPVLIELTILFQTDSNLLQNGNEKFAFTSVTVFQLPPGM